ncbi:aconitase X catalytic domain-containing protein [Pectinatus cerevisiiphilus]|uniref:Putative aconitase subunit 1 n=1 Tax=Pectinatus cerevisiiphilus TaxID=86956 RepID=A0A4V2URY0_9FIRM|nr:aconitase X catalytic domain-containing protein [Pectinatus cerevisiiphilus]TCS79312.1 putative aconitase subunit 1 [Pectinatus cerevisiiphilus]
MYLTKEEEKMLDGVYGKGTQLAMKILVAIGEAYDAPKMVPVTRTHVALSNQEADLWFAEKLADGGAKCRVRPTVNPSFNLEQFQAITNIDSEDEKIVKRTHAAYVKLGAIMTYDCTPYLERNVPRFGEIISFSESSATPFVNSVYGARSNRESAQSALCSAVTGVTPYYGFLLKENRAGQVLVHVEADMEDDFAYQMLGYFAPKKIGFAIPVFAGLKNPSKEALMNLGAQLNTGGNVALYHILGFTPEAQTMEDAFQGKKPQREVTITNADLKSMREEISDKSGKIDFALYGCPHFTIDQVCAIAELVDGKKLAVPLFIMTSALTRNLAKKMGYMDTIRAAGGEIVEDTCMDQPCWKFLYGKKGITDSPKCAYYTKRRDMQFVIAPLKDSVLAALKGEY